MIMKHTGVLSYCWYPLLVGGAIAAFGALLAVGSPLYLTLYAPIVAVALATIALQVWKPERRAWQPRWSDIKSDTAFIVLVQVVLPRLLAVGAALAAASWAHANLPSHWWPHDWALAVQVVLMVLCVDFLRYWLHRACHRYLFLWRLHEVHHSPDLLYALNVGRFHPLEKTLHFALDTVPFLLLGVAPQVMAGYFLIYSVNGFLQHSNVRLRHGWLNYLIASAEAHRWHHAKDPKLANCNFSSTTILWDAVFGTRYLPKRQRVREIGIMDRSYPKDFWSQLFAPFRRRPQAIPGLTLRQRAVNALIALNARVLRAIESRRIRADARDPMHAQRDLLTRIVRENRDTQFGRDHGFACVANYEDFAASVPVTQYETLRPYIASEIERSEHALTREPPVLYARTSGTTDKPKDVPLTGTYLKALRRIHRTAVAYQQRVCPQAFAGGILAITSPAQEGVLANGKPYGSASGMVAGNTSALIRDKFVLPPEVLTISDSRLKYLTILRLAIARSDVTYLGTANATTLLTLIKLYREHQAELIRDLRDGGFFLAHALTPPVRDIVQARLTECPDRAAQLGRLSLAERMPTVADLWPALRLVVTWTDGSAGITLQALKNELASHTRVLELGYLASEFRATFTLGKRAGSGLPTLDTHFFEFVERDKWDRGEPEFLTLDRIRKGVDYYVIVTTPSGLYRYFINDLVRVTGFLYRMPLLKFTQKGRGVTNITGEKLYESQVLEAVSASLGELGCAPRFMMMLADEQALHYRLFVEAAGNTRPDAQALAKVVDAKLMQLNLEYRAKRESDRLGALKAYWLKADSGEAYKQFRVSSGQREGQFKSEALAYRKNCQFDFNAWVGGA